MDIVAIAFTDIMGIASHAHFILIHTRLQFYFGTRSSRGSYFQMVPTHMPTHMPNCARPRPNVEECIHENIQKRNIYMGTKAHPMVWSPGPAIVV